MKSRLSILIAALLLPPGVPAQATVLEDPRVATATDASPPSITDAPLPTVPAAALVCAPVPPGAVAWWRGESNTVDTVGINDGLLDEVSAKIRSVSFMPGKVGAAFRFASDFGPFRTTNYFWVPPSADLDVGAGAGLTIEGWLSPGSITGVQPVAEWNDGRGTIGASLGLNGSALAGRAHRHEHLAGPPRHLSLRTWPLWHLRLAPCGAYFRQSGGAGDRLRGRHCRRPNQPRGFSTGDPESDVFRFATERDQCRCLLCRPAG